MQCFGWPSQFSEKMGKKENNVRSREKDPLSDHHAVFGLTLTKSGKIVWTERFLILKERTLFHNAVFGLTPQSG